MNGAFLQFLLLFVITMNNQKLWIQKGIWLIGLTIFFYISYGFANHFTLWRAENGAMIPSLMFHWEQYIPLLPWTILPYWIENFLYGLAIILCLNKLQLFTLGKRLLTVQIICVIGFLIYPMEQINIAVRPEMDGFFGFWFTSLTKFDLPYNQAPSLHIALLVILTRFYLERLSNAWRYLIYPLCGLIAISVLTTWQHHFIDIPTGAIAGCVAIWLNPDNKPSPFSFSKAQKNYQWAVVYFLSALIFLTIALTLQSCALWFLYPAFSLFLVSINYAVFGKLGFPKNNDGTYAFTDYILFLPYIFIARINSYLWARKINPYDEILPNLYLGSFPFDASKIENFQSIVDCCAEIPFQPNQQIHYYPNYLLDMTPLSLSECINSAKTINNALQHGKTLVFCALGYSRSATSIIAYLILYQGYSVKDAIQQVKEARPNIVIKPKQMDVLKEL